jgi:hypothetical protein
MTVEAVLVKPAHGVQLPPRWHSVAWTDEGRAAMAEAAGYRDAEVRGEALGGDQR